MFKTSINDKSRMILSTLWIYMVANYIYCDVFSLMEPVFIQALAAGGHFGDITITKEFLFIFSIVMQIPVVMIVLPRILPGRLNRVINIITALIMAMIQIWSFGAGSESTPHYIFFSIIELITLLVIMVLAVKSE